MKTTVRMCRPKDEIPYNRGEAVKVKPNSRGSVIVMADDDLDYHLIVHCALAEVGFRGMLQSVSNGVELMDYLHHRGKYKCAPDPDLIVLDMNMPEKDGRSALQEIKGSTSLCHIPVAVLTTSTREEDIEACNRFRKCTYAAKPATFKEWISIIDGMLREHLPSPSPAAPLLDEGIDYIDCRPLPGAELRQ
ncbi:MAG: response regulator [Desulfobacterales bacterium]|nr:response regulator [Desulfobacterales bacterium]